MSDYYYELFCLWPTWKVIVREVCQPGLDPEAADPQSVYGAACAADCGRLAACVYADDIAIDIDDARFLLDEVLDMTRDGFRPMSWREAGFADLVEEL